MLKDANSRKKKRLEAVQQKMDAMQNALPKQCLNYATYLHKYPFRVGAQVLKYFVV